MLVPLAGGRLWRFKYKGDGVEKLLTLGSYLEVSPKRARKKRDDARPLSSDGVDPTQAPSRRSLCNQHLSSRRRMAVDKKEDSPTAATWARDSGQLHKWDSLPRQQADFVRRSAGLLRNPQAHRSEGRRRHRPPHQRGLRTCVLIRDHHRSRQTRY